MDANPYQTPHTTDQHLNTSQRWYQRRRINNFLIRSGLAFCALIIGLLVGSVIGIPIGLLGVHLLDISSFGPDQGFAMLAIAQGVANIVGWMFAAYVLLYWTRANGWGLRSG